MSVEVDKHYWIRFYRDDAPWIIALRFPSENDATVACWLTVGDDLEYYDTEVNEVGPEIIPPLQ